jgi:hypothetical protein
VSRPPQRFHRVTTDDTGATNHCNAHRFLLVNEKASGDG